MWTNEVYADKKHQSRKFEALALCNYQSGGKEENEIKISTLFSFSFDGGGNWLAVFYVRSIRLKRLHLKELTSRPVGLSFHGPDALSLS